MTSRVLITGSADGLGLAAASLLLDEGHDVTLHARNQTRAEDIRRAEPRAKQILVGDLSSIAQTRSVAAQANDLGRFDAVIHNAAVGYTRRHRTETADGLELHFQVNVLAPYLLTTLIERPERLVWLSSGMHQGGRGDLGDPQWTSRRWSGSAAYSDTKLLDLVLAFGFARRWPQVLSNGVDPGWVATRMGGAGAPGSLAEGAATQAWLAVSDDPAATVTGGYFHHRRQQRPSPATQDVAFQDALADYCESLIRS